MAYYYYMMKGKGYTLMTEHGIRAVGMVSIFLINFLSV
jgi:hypothetical protein